MPLTLFHSRLHIANAVPDTLDKIRQCLPSGTHLLAQPLHDGGDRITRYCLYDLPH